MSTPKSSTDRRSGHGQWQRGVVGDDLRARLRRATRLPADARDTGYRLGDLELSLSPSDPDGVYLRVAGDIERWPRADPPVACA